MSLNIDSIGFSFLQENGRIPAFLNGDPRPTLDKPMQLESSLDNPGNEVTDTQKKENVKNVTVVSKSGVVYKGFVGRTMKYEETEMLCLSRGAKLPWFEMRTSEFSGPVWIE